MTSQSFTDISLRQRSRSGSMFRNALNRIMDAREQQARRFIADHLALREGGHSEAARQLRASLFEGGAPERR